MYIPSQKCENCHFYAKEYAKTAFTIELFCFLSLGVPKFRLPRFPPKKFYNIDLITELDDGLMCSGGPTYLPTYLPIFGDKFTKNLLWAFIILLC